MHQWQAPVIFKENVLGYVEVKLHSIFTVLKDLANPSLLFSPPICEFGLLKCLGLVYEVSFGYMVRCSSELLLDLILQGKFVYLSKKISMWFTFFVVRIIRS